MPTIDQSGTFALGDRIVKRLGYGAMQLAGPGVFGPPKDRAAALAVLRAAVAHGVNHIDTSDYYGPHVTNQLIREALHPYPDDLVIVTKIAARRGAARMDHGFRHSPPKSSFRRSTTICAISDWMCSTS
jgi:aryl-alcohol dehydrogenase-like predicted oxidoreductase